MGMNPKLALEMITRLDRNRKRQPDAIPADAVDQESKLHRDIMDWCDMQWPRVKYVHSRMDKKTTAQKGVPDFICFLAHGRTIAVEAKRKDGKMSEDQLAWRAEMRMLGHEVYEVRSMEQFLSVANDRTVRREAVGPVIG